MVLPFTILHVRFLVKKKKKKSKVVFFISKYNLLVVNVTIQPNPKIRWLVESETLINNFNPMWKPFLYFYIFKSFPDVSVLDASMQYEGKIFMQKFLSTGLSD